MLAYVLSFKFIWFCSTIFSIFMYNGHCPSLVLFCMSVTWRRCYVCIDEIGRFLREHLLCRRNSNQLAARGWATYKLLAQPIFRTISHFWGQGSEKISTWNCSTNITHCSPPECLCGKIRFFSKINKWGKRKSPHHPCRYFFIYFFSIWILLISGWDLA